MTDRGSGTVLGLALVMLTSLTFTVLQVPLQAVYAQSTAQEIADLAAIAAEDSLRGLSTGIPCEVAGVVAAVNHATLSSCRIVGNSVYVSVRSFAAGASIVAEAAAAPTGKY